MVNHMENTVRTMPSCVQQVLRSILKWLNNRLAFNQTTKPRKLTKANDRHKSNCAMKGANVESSVDLGHKSISAIRETDGWDHTRLPDPILRGIRDRYHELE